VAGEEGVDTLAWPNASALQMTTSERRELMTELCMGLFLTTCRENTRFRERLRRRTEAVIVEGSSQKTNLFVEIQSSLIPFYGMHVTSHFFTSF
jgi:hypothetical protein